MTGTHAITHLDGLTFKLDGAMAEVTSRVRRAEERWQGIGRVGGQRDDHAAELLADLRGALAHLADLATKCGSQIDAVIANPFDDPAPDTVACPSCAGSLDGALDKDGRCDACGWTRD